MSKKPVPRVIMLDEEDAEVISRSLSAMCEMVWEIFARRQMAIVRPTEETNVVPLRKQPPTPTQPLDEIF